MTITMINVLELNRFYNNIKNKKLPFQVAYKFSKIIRLIQGDVDFFEKEMDKLLNEYGKRDETGQFILTEDNKGIVIQEEHIDKCRKKMDELYHLPITIEGDISFTVEELDFLDMTPQEISVLMPFIRE
jgi:hypothetical protein